MTSRTHGLFCIVVLLTVPAQTSTLMSTNETSNQAGLQSTMTGQHAISAPSTGTIPTASVAMTAAIHASSSLHATSQRFTVSGPTAQSTLEVEQVRDISRLTQAILQSQTSTGIAAAGVRSTNQSVSEPQAPFQSNSAAPQQLISNPQNQQVNEQNERIVPTEVVHVHNGISRTNRRHRISHAERGRHKSTSRRQESQSERSPANDSDAASSEFNNNVLSQSEMGSDRGGSNSEDERQSSETSSGRRGISDTFNIQRRPPTRRSTTNAQKGLEPVVQPSAANDFFATAASTQLGHQQKQKESAKRSQVPARQSARLPQGGTRGRGRRGKG